LAEPGRWILTGSGALVAAVSGAFKLLDMQDPYAHPVWHFFEGTDYVFMAAGLFLMVLGLGYDLLFDPPHIKEPGAGERSERDG